MPARNQPPSPESLRRGFEQRDVRARPVFIALAGFALAGAVTLYALSRFVNSSVANFPLLAPTSAVREYAARTVAAPLQPSPGHDRRPEDDLESMRREEDRVFADLGWRVDAATHHAMPPADLVGRVADRANAGGRP